MPWHAPTLSGFAAFAWAFVFGVGLRAPRALGVCWAHPGLAVLGWASSWPVVAGCPHGVKLSWALLDRFVLYGWLHGAAVCCGTSRCYGCPGAAGLIRSVRLAALASVRCGSAGVWFSGSGSGLPPWRCVGRNSLAGLTRVGTASCFGPTVRRWLSLRGLRVSPSLARPEVVLAVRGPRRSGIVVHACRAAS